MCHGQWTGHEIATELPQNKIPHHATCLKYNTLIVICEHVTCLKQFRTVLSQIAFSGMIEARSKDGKELDPVQGLTRSKRMNLLIQ